MSVGLIELLESLPVPPREWQRRVQRRAKKRVGVEVGMDHLKRWYAEELGLVTAEEFTAAGHETVRRMLAEGEDGSV